MPVGISTLAEALRQANEAMVVVDAALRFRYVNPAFTELFGYALDEVRGRPLALISPPADAASSSVDEVARLAASRGCFRGEALRRVKDGGLVPVLLSVGPLVEGGDIVGFVGAITDLREVRRAEEALRESESLFRSASAAAQDGMILLDAHGRVAFWNRAAEHIFGYAADEILGRDLHPLLAPPRFREAYTAGLAEFRRTGTGGAVGRTVELSALRKGGEEFPIELSISSVRHGDSWLAIGIVRDISERKRRQAEASLFRTLIDYSNDAIEVVDPDTLRFLDVNDRECRDLGYSREELLSLSVLDIDPAFGTAERERLQSCIRESGRAVFESVHRRKDGSTFPVEISVRMVHLERAYFLAIVRDITERKRAEAETRAHLERLDRANRELKALNERLSQAQSQLVQAEKMASIGQLAAGVAHEINNPVGYVRSNVGTLAGYLRDILRVVEVYESAESLLDESTLERVRRVKSEVDFSFLKEDGPALVAESREGLDRVAQIVQDLKDFSHAGRGEEWKLADLHAGLDSTLNVVWNELKYHCTVEKVYGDLPPVECLPSQLNQVFMNLLVNSAQAIEGHGTVTLRTGRDGERVWIEVADTGKGIREDDLKRLFEPFYTTKPVGRGTGLGLSVSYSIVRRHHGELEVESRVGEGSVFRVWLPIAQPVTEDPSHDFETGAAGNAPARS